MNTLQLLVLLGLTEALLVLGVVIAMQFHCLRRNRAEAAELRRLLGSAPSMPVAGAAASPRPDYADLLQRQIDISNRLLGEMQEVGEGGDAEQAGEPGSASDADPEVRQMLAVRHQFLQVELDAQASDAAGGPSEWRARLVEGMQALVAGLRSSGAAAPAEASTGGDEKAQLLEQIDHLRAVIDNQHAVMRELRELLEAHGGSAEALQTALGKLSVAEREGEELRRRLGSMKREKERIQHASPDAELLRDLVGSQQRTIQNLQQLLAQISPAADKAEALNAALDTIQRTNSELNSCVMVLEDENAMLRGRVEALEARLAEPAGRQEAMRHSTDTDELLRTLFDKPAS